MDVIVGKDTPLKKNMDRLGLLSVLYVYDEPALLNVCKEFLERRFGISVTTVESAEKALAILETCTFDVILSDYQMPRTDGIGFLKILQEKKCSIPFILFTGQGQEEVAIEAMNHGARYYIRKGGDPRSQFAEIDQKVREASRRCRAEKTLRASDLCYRTLFENSGTAIAILDEDLTILRSNREFSLMSGYSRGEIDGTFRLTDLVPAEDIPMLVEFFVLLHRGPDAALAPLEMVILPLNRKVRYLSATMALIPATGQVIASFVDITRLHHLEEEERKRCAHPDNSCRQSPGSGESDVEPA